LRGGAREVPVAGRAAAAVLAGKRGVKKEGRCAAIAGKVGGGTSLPDGQDLDDWQSASYGLDDLRGFIAVELRDSEAQGLTKSHDGGLPPVHKDPDGCDEWREAAEDFGGSKGRDAAWAGFVEVQPDGVGAEVGGEFCVFPFGDATDFDADHGG
jgi:hypothetical protein